MPRVVSHLSHSIIRIPTFCSLLFVWSLNFFFGKRLEVPVKSSKFQLCKPGHGTKYTVKVLRWCKCSKRDSPQKTLDKLHHGNGLSFHGGRILPFYTKLFLGEGDMKSWSWKPPESVGSSSTNPSMAPWKPSLSVRVQMDGGGWELWKLLWDGPWSLGRK